MYKSNASFSTVINLKTKMQTSIILAISFSIGRLSQANQRRRETNRQLEQRNQLTARRRQALRVREENRRSSDGITS